VNTSLRRAAISFTIFSIVCLFGTAGLLAIFSQYRVSTEQAYSADFVDVSGLKVGDFVRIAGVEVGKVKAISINDASQAVVQFSAEPSVTLTDATKAAVRWENPIGDRYLALLEGGDSGRRLAPGGTIGVDKTEPALDLDTLLGGFRPLFRALDPQQVNTLSSQLISAFQGEGATISSFLTQAAAVTSTLADRDELIGQVIDNLNAVVGSFGGNTDEFGKAVDSLAELTKGLAEHKTDITNAVAHTNAASATLADLLTKARPAARDVVSQTDAVAAIVAADHDWFDNYLETLPQSYKVLSRLGIMGDFFTFYLCDLVLKVNGKGGQPVYVKLAGQSSGRCAPK
jgi:phospholipid/cholesterol/gamma-HCH transport system substrate-binding protein